MLAHCMFGLTTLWEPRVTRRFESVYTPAVLCEQYMLMLSLIFLVHPLLGHLEGSLPIEELHTE